LVTRPHSMTIIGWLATGLGCLMILSAAMVFLASRSLLPEGIFPPDPSLAIPDWIFRHLNVLAAAQTLIGILAVVAGAALLRLQAWARTVLEIMAWLALAYVLGFAFFWARTVIAITSHWREDSVVHVPSTPIIAMGILVTIALAVPLGVVIMTLRGTTVRGALSRPADTIESVGV
jgi:hypothetical protein